MEKNRNEVSSIIADNITYYRKRSGLTQLELAEKLNYSDKSISKWERGEGVPDIFVLNEMADLFGLTLDQFIKKRKKPFIVIKDKHLLAYFYASIVLFIGIFIYGIFKLLNIDYDAWKIIIYSLPLTSLVLLIFYMTYKKILWMYLYLTTFIWTGALSLMLIINVERDYFIFIIMIPIYVFISFLFYIVYRPKKIK